MKTINNKLALGAIAFILMLFLLAGCEKPATPPALSSKPETAEEKADSYSVKQITIPDEAGKIESFFVVGDNLYVAVQGEESYKILRARLGTSAWIKVCDGKKGAQVSGICFYDGGIIILQSRDDNYSISRTEKDGKEGEVNTEINTQTGFSGICAYKEGILVWDEAQLILLNPKNGEVIKKAELNSRWIDGVTTNGDITYICLQAAKEGSYIAEAADVLNNDYSKSVSLEISPISANFTGSDKDNFLLTENTKISSFDTEKKSIEVLLDFESSSIKVSDKIIAVYEDITEGIYMLTADEGAVYVLTPKKS